MTDNAARRKRLEQCRNEILAVLSNYPGIEISWSCDDSSDTVGIYDDKVVLSDGGFSELPIDNQ